MFIVMFLIKFAFSLQNWESGSDMEAETWYPTNMEELVTVDEVGEDDLIMEPDITELEEIVTVGQEEEERSLRSALAAGLEVKNEHSLLSTKEDKSNILEATIESEKENADISGSEGDNTMTKATHLNFDTEDKPNELHEIRSEEDSDQHDNDRKIDESSNFQLKLEKQYISSDPSKEEHFQQSDTLVDDYKEIETLESRNNEDKDILAKKSQEETNCGSEEKPKTQGMLYLFPYFYISNTFKFTVFQYKCVLLKDFNFPGNELDCQH